MADRRPNFVIVGGGLGGALMAVHLAKAGHSVDVYEMRPDVRTGNVTGGRSINLAVSHRGIVALRDAGLAGEVLATAVPMRGRLIHSLQGELAFQPYGKDDSQCIYSVSRAGLNMTLLDAARLSSARCGSSSSTSAWTWISIEPKLSSPRGSRANACRPQRMS